MALVAAGKPNREVWKPRPSVSAGRGRMSLYNDKYIDKKYAANYQKIVAALVTGTSLNPESEKVAIRAIVKFNIEPVAAIEYAIEKSRESKDNS